MDDEIINPEDQVREYFFNKLLYGLLFTNDFKKYLTDYISFVGSDIDYFDLINFYNYVDFKFRHLLDDQMKDNIVQLANHYKDVASYTSDSQKEMVFNTANEMISYSNSTIFDYTIQDDLIKREMERRNISPRVFKKLLGSKENCWIKLKEMYVEDINILLSYVVDDDSEWKYNTELDITIFMGIVEGLLDDLPILSENIIFLERVKKTLVSRYKEGNIIVRNNIKTLLRKIVKYILKTTEDEILEPEQYVMYKGIDALMWSTDYRTGLSNLQNITRIMDIDLIKIIYAELYKYKEILPDSIKDNIINLVNYLENGFRNSDLEDREDAIQLINEIKRFINESKYSTSKFNSYFANDFRVRGYSTFEILKYGLSGKYDIAESLGSYKALDYEILVGFLTDNEELYNKVKSDCLENSEFYMGSIRCIMLECPDIVKNELFMQRHSIMCELINGKEKTKR